jgi:hypothetical protein
VSHITTEAGVDTNAYFSRIDIPLSTSALVAAFIVEAREWRNDLDVVEGGWKENGLGLGCAKSCRQYSRLPLSTSTLVAAFIVEAREWQNNLDVVEGGWKEN